MNYQTKSEALSEADKANLETLKAIYKKLKTPAEREAFKYVCPKRLYPLVIKG